MSERKQEEKVKDVGVDNDCLIIELLNGLRLSGPLRTHPVYRDPVVQADARAVSGGEFARTIIAS